jgi:large subunit ribosomal protein L24
MKKNFSPHWNASRQPRKQRKYIYNAPLHVKHKFLSAHLSKELRKKHGKRSLPLRKGDEVLVMRGSFRKKKAKVSSVNLKEGFAVLEGIQRSRKDGTKVNIPFHPSNLQIQTPNLDDKKRLLNAKIEKKEKKSEAKTPKESKEKKAEQKTAEEAKR